MRRLRSNLTRSGITLLWKKPGSRYNGSEEKVWLRKPGHRKGALPKETQGYLFQGKNQQ